MRQSLRYKKSIPNVAYRRDRNFKKFKDSHKFLGMFKGLVSPQYI